MKICIVSSSGGHLYTLWQLREWWQTKERFWITDQRAMSLKLLENEKVYFGFFPDNRRVINAVKNLFMAIKLFGHNRPDVVISAGAGISVPVLLVAKFMGIKTVYIELFNFAPRQTLSGKMVRGWVDEYIVQNEILAAKLGEEYSGATL